MADNRVQREISFTVPLIPPDVNHYVRHTRTGKHYVTAEAKKFKTDFALLSRGHSLCNGADWKDIVKQQYELEVAVYFGKNQRGDGDNLWKCLADAMKESGVIHSDAAVTDWIMRVRRDWKNPRTEIIARVIKSGK